MQPKDLLISYNSYIYIHIISLVISIFCDGICSLPSGVGPAVSFTEASGGLVCVQRLMLYWKGSEESGR